MSTFWLSDLITLGAIIVISALVAVLFEYDGDDVSISYVILCDVLGAIPIANYIIGVALIIMCLMAMCDGDLEPKY